ncbi:hypothetical protein OS493_037780 [Desmophyllum pertusum]|uniref:ATP-dependent DNA helicase RecQ zinc-binding domain-containing protein n=1 Tax=Desmophyllum pertusum TaxID=174260 RepID=A0A9W9YI29_9CNID|nr:hypothetical protein OS493_037780 [Desmophyllum pertusum]
MLSYCQDQKSCRRSLIGRHFGESWNPTECHEMCDNCKKTVNQVDGRGSSPLEELDITNYCLDILKILQQAASLAERVTAIKLVDAWCGKGQPSLRMRGRRSPGSFARRL